ncbi:MAG: S-layer homology domain-containing protein, partial [Cohnella sp.]|nr:S-layer homology domain-containing protein [Cohnella sp.]
MNAIPFKRSKFLVIAALSLSLVAGGSSSYAAPSVTAVSSKEISSSEYAAFLKDKFGFTLSKKVTRGEFFVDLVRSLKLTPADKAVTFKDIDSSSPYYAAAATLYQNGILDTTNVNASGSLGAIYAVQLAVRAADQRELAYTYPKAKAEKAISKLPVKASSLPLATVQELAAAVDTGILPAAYYQQLKQGASLGTELANVLIGKTLELRGQFKQYLGYTGDPDIFAKVTDAYNQSTIIKSDSLQ